MRSPLSRLQAEQNKCPQLLLIRNTHHERLSWAHPRHLWGHHPDHPDQLSCPQPWTWVASAEKPFGRCYWRCLLRGEHVHWRTDKHIPEYSLSSCSQSLSFAWSCCGAVIVLFPQNRSAGSSHCTEQQNSQPSLEGNSTGNTPHCSPRLLKL